MKPDRSNYEIWFIDWVDGKLTGPQVEELKIFLSNNPDLREELETLSLTKLRPGRGNFPLKDSIKKSADSYSNEQFEHLCIAYLENDLSIEQIAELQEIISRDGQKKKTFDLICKLKLAPPDYKFTRKSSVKRLTIGQKISRLAITGFSAAAAIGILIALYFLLPVKTERNNNQALLNQQKDTILIGTPPSIIGRGSQPNLTATISNQTIIKKTAVIPEQMNSEKPLIEQTPLIDQVDSSTYIRRAEAVIIAAVKLPENIIPGEKPSVTNLRGYKPSVLPPLYDDNRSNVERFLAKFFHERILKDKMAGDRPVETFEIAEAGITGLNKLFGWQMALQKTTDENGDLKSYYFSSKLLKFNAPVKKSGKAL